ncbi:uncharacterized protein LOC132247345 [Alligator mississippiensis]|uniref:uncharacterized protein LOC132243825 n=1 Tax=Alligator mississippiensis TaxID=8496 RepID=UPI0028773CE8|nr:uncharacterized protein LOC132243825 [Alligator mississippiensis]XP_059570263.1 uncharacterized protein LOC132243825 [Alligator mississippiensis]XP_059570264.1 uncharacterized protein LOC132243825 [Alligator mississippiensis]XP_059570265.1 uncharacterized protein LOC132243825 [Alligator mississippiensis]XP_059570266.1 uncharacterized protein LOC132243825 [Alligator mississippiensis]XP_059570267.1 uncharacterized protein LOC132243825 [Alligator mississippiensis]XP_059570268.1 uncharacterize
MINVLFRAFANATRYIKNLNSQLLTLGKVTAKNAAAQESPTPSPQYGASEKLSFFKESEKKGGASEKDAEDRVVGGPQLPHSLREYNGADPTAPTPEHQLPPPYDEEKKPSKLIYPPSLPTENPPPPMKSSPTSMKTAFPIVVTKYTTDPQGVTHATSTYRTHNRTEIQDIFQLSEFKPGETLAIWLGRLVVEFGSELLDMEEASFLIRQAAWSGGHATDRGPIMKNQHWAIPLPVLLARQIVNKSHLWHNDRPEITSAKQLLLATIGTSYYTWDGGPTADGYSTQQVRLDRATGRWAVATSIPNATRNGSNHP